MENSSLSYKIGKFFSRYTNKFVLSVLKMFVKLDEKTLVFFSRPDYSDNGQAFAEYLANSNGSYRIYFCVDDVDKVNNSGLVANGIKVITNKNRFGEYSFCNLKIFASAKYVLSTHAFPFSKSSGRNGQRFIRLWHGCGYKDKTDTDAVGIGVFDKALVPGPLFIPTKSRFWNVPESYLMAKGYPRYDWMLHPTEKAISLYNHYAKGNNKVVMWMPTFRNDNKGRYNSAKDQSQFPLLYSQDDWLKLDSWCSEFGIILLLKIHIFQSSYNVDMTQFKCIRIISNDDFAKARVAMYEFLAVTDGLISDYSSVAVDYLVVDKPTAFVLDDYEEYKQKRGFVFDDPREYMPGHHVYNMNDMKKYLADLSAGSDSYSIARREMRKCAIVESDCYCKDIAVELGILK